MTAIVTIMSKGAHPVTTAGPKARAGLMHIEETGPTSHMRRQTTKGIASGFSFPHCDLQHSQGLSLYPAFQCACTRLSALVSAKPWKE